MRGFSYDRCEQVTGADNDEVVLGQRRRQEGAQESPDRHPGLRQPGPRACAQPQGQRPRRGRRRPQERRELEEGQEGRPQGRRAGRCREGRVAGRDAGARSRAEADLYKQVEKSPGERRHPVVRPWPQHPLQADQAAQGSRRLADRPQGSRRPRAPPVPAGSRRPLAASRCSRTHGQGIRQGAGLRPRHRRHARRRSRDHVRGRDRDGSVRRAGRALRRHQRPRHSRASRRWWKPVTSPRSRTTKCCTN